MTLFPLFTLLGGLAFFLFGMNVMSGSLEKMSGGKLEHLLKRVTANKWIAIGIGILITVIMQSSSASTVMLVSLVNSGIMEFSQTLGFIFGANIGTTLTSWLLALSGIESDNVWVAMLKPENFAPLLAFIGIVMIMFSKKEQKKGLGTILVGFGILMFGMNVMSDAVSPLSELPAFKEALLTLQNPILGVLVGLIFTAIIQSSAASIGILMALSLSGNITFGTAVAIVMGQNIGTCITALISCIGTSVPAKRVAVTHLSIKVIGTVICLSLYEIVNAIFALPLHNIAVTSWHISMIHTVFNTATCLILAPFTTWIVRMVERIVPVRTGEASRHAEQDVFPLDDRLLRSPSVAIGECDDYSKKMCVLAHDTVLTSFHLLFNYDEQAVSTVLTNEDKLDLFEDKLSTYLVKLSSQSLSMQDTQKITKCLHTLGDFERLGDHAVNLYKVAKEIHDKKIVFSDTACRELSVLSSACREIVDLTSKAYTEGDVSLATRVEPLEQVIDQLIADIKTNHISRLQTGQCTIELGFVLSDMLTNFERVSDHCSNIAVAIIEVTHNSFDTHQYLNSIKYGNDNAFDLAYTEFSHKYAL